MTARLVLDAGPLERGDGGAADVLVAAGRLGGDTIEDMCRHDVQER